MAEDILTTECAKMRSDSPKRGRQAGRISAEEWQLIQAYRAAEERQRMPPEEPPRPPQAFAYIRCSHLESVDSGLGFDAQERMIRRSLEGIRESHPEITSVAWLREHKAISAYKVPFFQRPEGKHLNSLLRSGDHVVFAYLSRGWRSTHDCLHVMRCWDAIGVTVHFADMHIDTKSAQGKFLLTVLAACAEMDSDMKSMATREALAGMKALGRKGNGHAPVGYKLIGPKGKRRAVVPDLKQREVMAEVVRARDELGLSWAEIGRHIRKWMIDTDRIKLEDTHKPYFRWYPCRCKKMYSIELELRSKAWRSIAESSEVPPETKQ